MIARTALLALGAIVSVAGCDSNADTSQCPAFATHMADILATEAEQEVTAENREKMIKATTEACVADPPSASALKCALAAETGEAMRACDKQE